MTEENLKWLENVFRRTVGENGEIRLQDFKNIVHSKNVSKVRVFWRGHIIWQVCYVLCFPLKFLSSVLNFFYHFWADQWKDMEIKGTFKELGTADAKLDLKL